MKYYNIELIYSADNSQPNLEFKELLDKHNIFYEQEFKLDKKYFDFKIDNTLIEIDPYYTHNSTIGFRNKKDPLPEFYHLDKTKLALTNGYECIHIFDWDDKEKIINLLLQRERLNARNCIIKLVQIDEAKNI